MSHREMTRVVVTGLYKSFGYHPVLRGLDLEVPEGSLTAVLGPSGSGKTTLLRVMTGFERADRGSVTLGGKVVEDRETHLPPERRHIGYVPQDGALFPHLDAAANVGFGLPREVRRGGRVEELLDLVGLGGEGSRYPHQLSGGQQQRVALARALAVDPGLVLLDEPFSSLDATMRAEVRSDVRRVLRATGTTAVLVTHDQDEALSLADRIAVLRDGRVVQYSTPEDLYAHPVDPSLARFVGDANLLEGVMSAGMAVTSLGALPVDTGSSALREADRVLVLVRPEQIEILADPGSEGLGGRVAQSHYYGHDMVTTIETDGSAPTSRIDARIPGGTPLAPGTAVKIRATGTVAAWLADDAGSPDATPLD